MASLTSDRAFSRYSLFPILSENGSIANCLLKAAGLGYRWGTSCNVLVANPENQHDVVGCGGQVLRHHGEAAVINDEIMIAAAMEIRATLQAKLNDMSTDTIELSRAEAILATGMIGALVGLISDDEPPELLN